MSIKIRVTHHEHGASGIRWMRIDRRVEPHRLFEVEVDVRLEGRFRTDEPEPEGVWPGPTELAERIRGIASGFREPSLESLGLTIGRELVADIVPASRAAVELAERRWLPASESGHAARAVGGERHTARVIVDAGGARVRSGLLELGLLQTGAGPDALVFGDRLRAVWDYRQTADVDYPASRSRVRDLLIEVFAKSDASTPRRILWNMGVGVLSAMPEIWRLELVLPQLPCRPFDGPDGSGAAFYVPMVEPAGRIEVVLERT